jgi:hypothetical protein
MKRKPTVTSHHVFLVERDHITIWSESPTKVKMTMVKVRLPTRVEIKAEGKFALTVVNI